jgi:hypothetical protein
MAGAPYPLRDQSIVVMEPTCATEFEIQATVWHGLRARGINARGEVKTAFHGRQKCRFDVAVFASGALAGIVEIKRADAHGCRAAHWAKTRQGSRYVQFGVPVRLCSGMAEAEQLLADAAAGALWADDKTTQA